MKKYGIFPTPLYKRVITRAAEMKDGLVEDIERWRMENVYGIQRSNAGRAWHSGTDAFERPAWAELTDAVMDAAGDVLRSEDYVGPVHPRLIEMWANYMRDGGWMRPHTHGNADWSGVYFISCPPVSEPLRFHTPVSHARRLTHIEPANEGVMLIFPSWLMHYVEPTVSVEFPRITASFNFVVRRRPPEQLTESVPEAKVVA